MKFMDVHNHMPGIDQESMRKAHQEDLELGASEGVRFLHAWGDPQSGKVFCLSEGPDKETVQRIHEKAGHPADEIYEIAVEV